MIACSSHRRRVIVLGQARPAVARQQPLQLARAEADQPEVDAELRQIGQLEPQQRLVPARAQRELVVSEHICALLRVAHVRELDHRHLGEPELVGGKQPAVAGQHTTLLVHEHRVGPAEFDHRGRDLVDLRLAMGARVALVRA